jgi:Spy/CpxP family protein refolding chaperone
MKKIITTFLFVCITLSVYSQNHGKKEHIKALKIAHITEKLSLTEKEAQKFWPIYNAYDERMFELKFKKIRKLRREINDNIETIDDKKAQELINKLTEAENSLHNERKQLTSKLSKILPPKKILLLKIAEEEFNHKLFEQYKRRRHGFREKQ